MKRNRTLTSLSTALVIGFGLTACGEEFDPRSTLSGYRVIGVEASPPEVGPEQSFQVTAHDYNDDDTPVAYRWSLCPYSAGAAVDYACFDPGLEVDLGGGSSVQVDLGAAGLDLRARLSELGSVPYPDGTPRTLERGLDLLLRLESGPDCEGCDRIRTVKRVTVREGGVPNDNPVIDSFGIDGALEAGATVALVVSTDAEATYVDAVSGQELTEEYLYTWYTTVGQAEPGLTFGAERQTELTLPEEPGPVELVVAVRDGRGGLAVARQVVDVN